MSKTIQAFTPVAIFENKAYATKIEASIEVP